MKLTKACCILLIFTFLMSSTSIASENWIESLPESSAVGYPNSFCIGIGAGFKTLEIRSIDDLFEWSGVGLLTAADTIYAGKYEISLNNLYTGLSNLYSSSGTTLPYLIIHSVDIPAVISPTVVSSLYVNYKLLTNGFLVNTTILNRYEDNVLSPDTVNMYYTNGSTNTIRAIDTRINTAINYQLKSLISINSIYFDLSNVKIFYRSKNDTTMQSNFGSGEITLSNPYYRLYIYDLENNLLYQDTADVLYTRYRTITIDSLKIQNNADELIQVSVEEHGHFLVTNSTLDSVSSISQLNLGMTASSISYDTNHSNIIKFRCGTTNWPNAHIPVTPSSSIDFEFWFKPQNLSGAVYYLVLRNATTENCGLRITNGEVDYVLKPTGWTFPVSTIALTDWTHIRLIRSGTAFKIYFNQTLWYECYTININAIVKFYVGFGSADYVECYVDALNMNNSASFSVYQNYYADYQRISITNAKQVSPYNHLLTSKYSNSTQTYYKIWDIYSNELQAGLTSANLITYTPPNTFQCFISLANQRGEYLNWENYRIYVNSTQIYSNTFYYELGSMANVSIYTRFNRYITSSTHTVTRTSNYIPITLTQFSLKVYNQQSSFIYSNITFDPDYYVSSQVWSEWLAPNEIAEYLLSAGDYLVNITEYETSTETIYSYSLAGDDILMVSSSNTISNVLTNIQNVNSTIGNQITNVQIDLTNQNSDINNTIINLNINLNNTNSSLTNLLLNQETSINNIANNISTLYVYQQNQFTYVTNNITSSFTSLNSSIYLVNNSIYTAINAMEANLLSVNNTIHGNLTLILAQNEYLTQIYQYCYFSDFLDWSNASRDASFISSQVDTFTFINQFKNESVEFLFRYNNLTETLLVGADDISNELLPKTGVTVRVWSAARGEYLTEWQPINATNYGGWYEPDLPPEIDVNAFTFSSFIILIAVIAVIVACIAAIVRLVKKRNYPRKEPETKESREKESTLLGKAFNRV